VIVTVEHDYEVVFRAQFPRLVSLGVAMTGRRDIAYELAQETMLRAHRRWDEIAAYDTSAAWLRRVMVNLLIDHHRSRTAERAAVERLAGQGAVVIDAPSIDRWHELVSLLPRQQRAIVSLYYADDQSVESIADTLGISTGAVKKSLFKARQTLQRRLAEEVRDA
jgi:RNA polymerase sigma-70 factor, ECF subfamily